MQIWELRFPKVLKSLRTVPTFAWPLVSWPIQSFLVLYENGQDVCFTFSFLRFVLGFCISRVFTLSFVPNRVCEGVRLTEKQTCTLDSCPGRKARCFFGWVNHLERGDVKPPKSRRKIKKKSSKEKIDKRPEKEPLH